MSPIWLSPEPAPGLTGGQAQRHADLEGDVRERQRVEIDRMRLAGGRFAGDRRLRYMLKEELFIRTPDGMVPTPRAEQLAALYAGR
jgi:hypothetical protein